MSDLVLAIDLGTGGPKVALVDETGAVGGTQSRRARAHEVPPLAGVLGRGAVLVEGGLDAMDLVVEHRAGLVDQGDLGPTRSKVDGED